uniref:Small ribosomal subunit protein uS13m n=1 Tax=Coleochaete scutata TaxID=3125 RepID=A0A5P9NWN8_COLSC|nr:ribosomal protein S13 [Coleochaete scutata]QFU80143.1 ribosomal protein S13 [Coleochaete scutata]QIQ23007.1 ribosomal protein S13 [Coleochaete scutata]
MFYICGARLPMHVNIRMALTRIYGIGSSRASEICYALGLSETIRVKRLTQFQIRQLTLYIENNFFINRDLNEIITKDMKRLRTVGCYRGLRHHAGLPCRGQRTHTNAKTSRKISKK